MLRKSKGRKIFTVFIEKPYISGPMQFKLVSYKG